MVRPARVAVTLTVLLVIAGIVGPVGTAMASPAGETAVATPHTTDRPDPETDTIGWEDGYWYNESISVNRSDGLSEADLEIVVARAMARVEVVRQLEFKKRVPVTIISRETFRERNAGYFANASTEDRLHQNTKFEALFMVGESTNTIEVQQQNRGSSVLGYYDYQNERIVIVSEDTESPQMNEITLAQELFHAIQDQYFNLSNYSRLTEEENNAVNGIVEGDGNYVDYLYNQRCDSGSWGNCLMPQGERSGGGDLANVGIYLIGFQPYSDGPAFVANIKDREGWEGVNAVYDDPPDSTEQTIHPEKYRTDPPQEVTIENRSSGEWRVLDLNNSIDYAEFGEAGIFSMFWYASYEATQRSGSPESVVVSYRGLFNTQPGGSLDPLDPYNYTSRYSAGWDGDRLVPYVTNTSAITNETGYVWKIAWDSPRDAEEFYAGYQRLLEYHEAEQVGINTYRLPADSEFNDAIHVIVEGDTVTIVNAPTVTDLSKVNSRVVVRTPTPSTPSNSADTSQTITATRSVTPTVATASPDASTPTAEAPETTSPGQPGFGLLVLLVALVVAVLGYRRRRR
ncbi:MAG: Hvo_1808 family surface protein [Halobacteriales archaeon]